MKLHHVIEAQQFNPPALRIFSILPWKWNSVVAHGGTLGIPEAHHGHALLRTLHAHALLL